MTKKYKIITALLIFIVALILVLQIDDDIEVEAQEMYHQATAYKESEAYVYLLGMHAGADDDPKDIGEKTLQSIREFEENYSLSDCNDDTFEFYEYPHEGLTPIELNSCDEENCEPIDQIFAQKFDSNNLPRDQVILLSRYKKYLSFKDLHTLSTPNVFIPFPLYSNFMRGSDLINLVAIDNADKHNFEESKLMLLKNISGLRRHLAQADTLISKMIYLAALSKSINVLSILKNKHTDQYDEINIQPLNREERSMVKAMIYENALIHNFSKSLSACPNDYGDDLYIPRWVYKTVYKPNMTINKFYKENRQISEKSLINSEEFTSKKITETPSFIDTFVSRNIMGNIAYNNTPHFNSYIARVFALDAKIKLFNESDQNPSLKSIGQIKNPFYKSGKFAYFSEDKKSICFDAPYIERDRDRCLRVKY